MHASMDKFVEPCRRRVQVSTNLLVMDWGAQIDYSNYLCLMMKYNTSFGSMEFGRIKNQTKEK